VFLASVNGGRTLVSYRKGEVIFSQGKPADAVFYIQKGKVKITVISEQGKEAIVAVLGADEFFGEGCLTGQPLRLATAAAMTECEIMRLEKGTMVRVLHEEPAFSEFFVAHLLTRTARVEADLVDQLFNSSEKRLARCAPPTPHPQRIVEPAEGPAISVAGDDWSYATICGWL
jgi:CRP/FNR family cyclic AMP-dependent transcriptional regulator